MEKRKKEKMNYTFDKSKLTHDQLITIEKMKQKIKNEPKKRKTNLENLFIFWIKKGINLNNEPEWNFLIYYFMELGFTYSEILNEAILSGITINEVKK